MEKYLIGTRPRQTTLQVANSKWENIGVHEQWIPGLPNPQSLAHNCSTNLSHSRWVNEVVNRITSIYLPKHTGGLNDKRIWAKATNGCYTVKSGYNGVYHSLHCDWPSTSKTSNSEVKWEQFWEKFWTLRLPLCIQFFIWCSFWFWYACPIAHSLAKRGVNLSPSYIRCGNSHKIVTHMLLGCPEQNRFGHCRPLGLILIRVNQHHFNTGSCDGSARLQIKALFCPA